MEKFRIEPSQRLVNVSLRESLLMKLEKKLGCRNSIGKYNDWCPPRSQFSPILYPNLCDRNVLQPAVFVPLYSLCIKRNYRFYYSDSSGWILTNEAFAFCSIMKCQTMPRFVLTKETWSSVKLKILKFTRQTFI